MTGEARVDPENLESLLSKLHAELTEYPCCIYWAKATVHSFALVQIILSGKPMAVVAPLVTAE